MRLEIVPPGAPLPFGTAPYPHVAVDGQDVLPVLARLRAEQPHQTPVVWGDAEDAALLFEPFWDARSIAPIAILQRSRAGTGAALLERYKAEVAARLEARLGESGIAAGPAAAADSFEEPADAAGLLALPWPADVEPNGQLTGFLELAAGRPKPQVLIGLLPTRNAHETAAWHKFGNWNDCPPPEVHAALARDWHARYGARPVVNTHDVLELEIERPIATREEAVAMALVHRRYCSDVVDQGIGSVLRLAAFLLGARYWYFWWD